MKKYIKYFVTSIFAFVFLISGVSAATIKETTINGDGYDTVEAGSIIIGVTKFDSNVIITGSRATVAGSNDAIVYMMLNSSLDGYSAPSIYIYAGGAWFVLDDNNVASVVEDANLINKLSNNDIYFVNNIEKKIDVDVSSLNVDEEKLPKGITYNDGKVYVPATMNSFKIPTKEGKVIEYIKDNNNNEFIVDNSNCFTVSNGMITDYSNTCSCDVELPSKIDGVEITGIKKGAFQNKGITSVVIPSSIVVIEENAFADNNLTSVIINDKYDKDDFTTLSDTAFGTFKDFKYKNELTSLLDQFKDELTLNVRKGTLEQKYEFDEEYQKHKRISDYARYLEIKRLGLTETENALINNKYSVGFAYRIENNKEIYTKPYLYIGFFDGNKYRSVEKEISYTINEVEGKNEDYLNIKDEYLDYFEQIKTKIKNKEFNEKLIGIDGLIDIADKYNYDLSETYYGDYGDGFILEPITGNYELYYENIPYYFLEGIPYYESVPYKLTVDEKLETDKQIYDAMEAKFVEETSINDYEVLSNERYADTKEISYYIEVLDKQTENLFHIEYAKKPLAGTLVLRYESDNSKSYQYYPKKSLSDFDGKVSDYFDNAITELNEDYSAGLNNYMVSYGGTSEDPDENGLYESQYTASVTNLVNNNTINYDIGVVIANENKYSTKFFELEKTKLEDYETEEEYKKAGFVEFFEKVKIDNYYINTVTTDYVKNQETGEFENFYMNANNAQKDKLTGHIIYDFNSNTAYILLLKNFYEREGGSLMLYDKVISGTHTTYQYKYFATKEYNEFDGKFSEYIEFVETELKEKIKMTNEDWSNFNIYNSYYPDRISYGLNLSFTIDENTSKIYFVELIRLTDIPLETVYYEYNEIKAEDYNTQKEYSLAAINKVIEDNNISDYYISEESWVNLTKNADDSYRDFNPETDKEEDRLAGFIFHDFESNKKCFVVVKPYN